MTHTQHCNVCEHEPGYFTCFRGQDIVMLQGGRCLLQWLLHSRPVARALLRVLPAGPPVLSAPAREHSAPDLLQLWPAGPLGRAGEPGLHVQGSKAPSSLDSCQTSTLMVPLLGPCLQSVLCGAGTVCQGVQSAVHGVGHRCSQERAPVRGLRQLAQQAGGLLQAGRPQQQVVLGVRQPYWQWLAATGAAAWPAAFGRPEGRVWTRAV